MSIDVSVIVPTYRRDFLLAQCLDSLAVQDYPPEKVEWIVIDDSGNRSLDRSWYKGREKFPALTVLFQDHQGPAVARNRGIQVARGNIICLIDDDCVAGKGWLRSMVQQHEEHPEMAAVGGLTVTSTDRIPVLLGQFLANNSIQTYINGEKETIFFPTCNVSFKRRVLEEHRFNEHFPLPGGEDLELFWRLFKSGHRFLWKKEIQVIHYRHDTLMSSLRQAYIYGRGNFLVQYLHQDHPLLHELKTGRMDFWFAAFVNFFKATRFSFLQGRALIQEKGVTGLFQKIEVYAGFFWNKIFYLAGNIVEYFRIKTDMQIQQNGGAL
jgi:GT2 family glycosyltransferase